MVKDLGETVEIIINNGDTGKHPYPLPKNPMRRDTINIPGGGHAIIRFQSTNPGIWLLHCHIEWHFEADCKAQGIPTTGNAAGNKGLDMSGYMMGLSTLPTTITATGWGAMVACAISSFIGVATVICN
ncbi:hypothetical protein BCR33DRAFT_711668 [Rhizoclosmatium globosum]|uniref:Plastocyanin-like domain-containing protein n=1 Tax=Rhizoclosmatium globosum TaxID=329046 RepID=A0A1Y2CZB4_9FUNG|nr:hypothetical protein BCR33DRAFT_711668 [Rhizoclosmatium globosum]|eukprot:ORY52340.1 hypothetical protein BCR33DRAFT_711668 [Rhizoclosmatium globosum]